MTKEESFQIVNTEKEFYVNTYNRIGGDLKLIQVYGPLSEAEAINLKNMNRFQRNKFKKRRLISLAKNVPCGDCGEQKSPSTMTFDHCRGKKIFDIANGDRKSWERLFAEIQKCVVCCRSCHNIREYLRGRSKLTSVVDLAELLSRHS